MSSPQDGFPEFPERLVDLVEMASKSTVSRVLARTGGGSITLFAFAAGQELSEHTAPFDAMVHVLEGELGLTVGGRAMTVSAGEAVIMPADVPHALAARQDCRMLLVMLRDAAGGD
jgi:quercetin dioxygenase-like cupin family protein